MSQARIAVPQGRLEEFCKRYKIVRLAFFGSVPRDDFRRDGVVDVLVEFAPGRTPGLLGMAGLELEPSEMLGRKVDLRTPAEISRCFRARVLEESEPQYVPG